MKYLCDASADADGIYTVTVKPNSVLTATTLENTASAEYSAPLPVEGARSVLDTDATGTRPDTSDKVLYADDFDYSTTPKLAWVDGTESNTERQISPKDCELLVDGTAAFSGNVATGVGGTTIPGFKAAAAEWHRLALQAVGSEVTAFIDGVRVAAYTDPKPRLSGRVDLASGYYYTRFDNLKVETVDGSPPYYAELLDDLELFDLASPPNPKLVYGGAWAHANGKGMYNYQRSLSTSQGTGSTLKYTFTGTGLDVLGPNAGSAKLEVTVDGQAKPQASTNAAAELYQTFSLRGLNRGPHTVQIKVVSGTLVVDSVGVVY